MSKNKKLRPFSGTGVALITPFRNYAIDYPALGEIINFVIDSSVDYVVSLGTTGEAITLSSLECRQILDFTIEQVDGRVPVVAGYFGSNYTEKLVNSVREYNFDGVDAIMSSSPAYSKPPQEGIYRHYMQLAEASSRPIIIYNVPGRTASNVTANTILRLARASEQFVAVKEASGDLVQATKILKERPDHLTVLSGEDPLTLPMIGAGADGVISVIANVFPAHFSEMVRAALAGDFARARQLNFDLLDVHPWLYIENNPVGIKAAMEIAGLCSKEVRIPLVSLSDPNYLQLKAAMDRVPEFRKA
ncbi:4-hydroxy-tetrahydrodipicolinate synthase [Flavilitoribacter nigricans]|uniref:4-hydroxy-tetrahydrodipicolinate synthase n=1 Tax=Flavilitoribacter nigricans (strain ATCC 23147 / DSM 23189 / NBRC 102662 / NCIMB 1420 / SS-2) TaxID=1122177 RepID=A0A2D0N7J6_FLAN2|nr:4-hydroxy-tetrahydrodipicolinate synthase [Flavilitoribacter nigricans]PHN04366.1 4-hydroxy-tetrahydrodipicolinate synthase [Flavilitoribacter nigricans DSM 23189 = NBRC 102662]